MRKIGEGAITIPPNFGNPQGCIYQGDDFYYKKSGFVRPSLYILCLMKGGVIHEGPIRENGMTTGTIYKTGCATKDGGFFQ
jgi:hypothetical protein